MSRNQKYFTLEIVGGLHNKVAVIKAIRMLTSLGLKEAKDASEASGEQTFPISEELNNNEVEEQFRILRTNGARVGAPVHLILDELRQLAIQAMEMDEDELANEITQLVLAEKLRRKASGQLN
jgi:hypothetical protein